MTTATMWQDLPAAQQPEWPDLAVRAEVLAELGKRPTLVAPGEVDHLTTLLAKAAEGRAFVLQGGDCAEPFGVSEARVLANLRVLLQMTMILMYTNGLPVVKIGRMAGQYGKPRSKPTEVRGGVELPAYRGEIVNGAAFTLEARTPDPRRMLWAYDHAAVTLNLIRMLTGGGFADLAQVHQWNSDFVAASPQGKRYEYIAAQIARALDFMRACDVDVERETALHQAEFFVSHEALVLDYEVALTRPAAGGRYDLSAHMLWIGERTRQLDHAHVAFLAGVKNPIGVKLGPAATVDEVLALCEKLNPHNIPGRLTLVARMGNAKVRDVLPPLLGAVKRAGHKVVWTCDPMHGNNEERGGYKTRHFDRVLDEVLGFFEACRMVGAHPGGLHLELTGEDVTECLGGGDPIEEGDLGRRHETLCDPRLNVGQSLDLTYQAAELLLLQ